MENSENQSNDDSRLRKNEIIRGHDSYSKVLKCSALLSSDSLKAFVNKESIETFTFNFTISPLFTNNVKVGFIIAKKKIKNASLRNRIRRLLKESYRLNKKLFEPIPLKLNIIFSLTENGYKLFLEKPKMKFEYFDAEMKVLGVKINNYLKK